MLEDITIDEYKQIHELFDIDLYEAIKLETCVAKRISEGSAGPEAVMAQINHVDEFLTNERNENEKDIY